MVKNNILIHDSIKEFLQIVGFRESEEAFYVDSPDITTAFIIDRYMANFIQQCKEKLARSRHWRPSFNCSRVRRNIDFYRDRTDYLVDLSQHFKSDPIQQEKQRKEKEQLEAFESLALEKKKILSQPPKDRQIRIYPQAKEKKI